MSIAKPSFSVSGARTKQVEEAEFIRSVCEMDRSPIQHEEEGGGGEGGTVDDSDDDL